MMCIANPVFIVEVKGSINFHDLFALQSHVKDHILGNVNERWQGILTAKLVSKARFNHDTLMKDQGTLDKLQQEYQSFLSDEIQNICESGKEHMHMLEYKPDPQNEHATRVFVRSWVSEDRLVIIAAADVRNGEVQSYYLKTGYLDTKMTTQDEFTKHCISRFKDYQHLKPRHAERCIAEHY